MPKCTRITRSGKQCKNNAVDETACLCKLHMQMSDTPATTLVEENAVDDAMEVEKPSADTIDIINTIANAKKTTSGSSGSDSDNGSSDASEDSKDSKDSKDSGSKVTNKSKSKSNGKSNKEDDVDCNIPIPANINKMISERDSAKDIAAQMVAFTNLYASRINSIENEISRMSNLLSSMLVAQTGMKNNGGGGGGGGSTNSGGSGGGRNGVGRKVTEKGIWRKAKSLYYKEMKHNEEMLGRILQGLRAGNVIKEDATTKDVPWLNVKICTDHLFQSTLSDAERQMYFNVARDMLNKSISA